MFMSYTLKYERNVTWDIIFYSNIKYIVSIHIKES